MKISKAAVYGYDESNLLTTPDNTVPEANEADKYTDITAPTPDGQGKVIVNKKSILISFIVAVGLLILISSID